MEKNKGKAMGIAALVTGIISIVTLEFIIISIIFAILAITFGIISIRKGDRGTSKAGLILGIASLAVTLLLFIFLKVLDISLFTIPSWYKLK